MKKLYNRNKELEEYHITSQKPKQEKDDNSYEDDDFEESTNKGNIFNDTFSPDQKAIEDLERMLADFKKREAIFEKELQEKDAKIK